MSLSGQRRDQGLASEQPLVGKAEVGGCAIANHDMIHDGDAQELAGLDQALREGAILAAGLRVAAGVVVAAEDGGRVGQDGGFKCFAHMHHTRRQAPDGDGIDPDGGVFAVQQDDHEVLAVHRAEVLSQQLRGILGTA